MSRDCSRSHSGQIARVKQPDQLLLEINFVDTIGHCFESHRLPNKARPIKRSRPCHLTWPRLRTRRLCHPQGYSTGDNCTGISRLLGQ